MIELSSSIKKPPDFCPQLSGSLAANSASVRSLLKGFEADIFKPVFPSARGCFGVINAATTLVEDSSEVEENGQGGGGAMISSERERAGLEKETSAVRPRGETFKCGPSENKS